MDHPKSSAGLEFIDGYLFRFIQEILDSEGIETGLYHYYQQRILLRLGGLTGYEKELARYVFGNLRDRRVLHAGVGLGTLASSLAVNGIHVLGVEMDPRRMRLAQRVRDAVCRTWPEADPRYQLVQGIFPNVITEDWIGRDVIALFTNIASGMDYQQLERISEFLPQLGGAVVSLRFFGRKRDTDTERRELFDYLARRAANAVLLPDPSMEDHNRLHFARFSY